MSDVRVGSFWDWEASVVFRFLTRLLSNPPSFAQSRLIREGFTRRNTTDHTIGYSFPSKRRAEFFGKPDFDFGKSDLVWKTLS